MQRPRARTPVVIAMVVSGVALLAWAWRAEVRWFELHVLPQYCAMSPK